MSWLVMIQKLITRFPKSFRFLASSPWLHFERSIISDSSATGKLSTQTMSLLESAKKAAAFRAVDECVKVSRNLSILKPISVDILKILGWYCLQKLFILHKMNDCLLQDKDVVGVGSGSTVVYAVERLGLFALIAQSYCFILFCRALMKLYRSIFVLVYIFTSSISYIDVTFCSHSRTCF